MVAAPASEDTGRSAKALETIQLESATKMSGVTG